MLKIQAVLFVLMAMLSGLASAALPAEATAAFTALSSAVTDILALVWPVVSLVVVGFITVKLFKRGGNKV